MLTFQVIALRKTQEKANKQVYSNRSPGIEVILKFQRKGRGWRWRMEDRYIYKGERKNPPSFLGPRQILESGYFSQLLGRLRGEILVPTEVAR